MLNPDIYIFFYFLYVWLGPKDIHQRTELASWKDHFEKGNDSCSAVFAENTAAQRAIHF